MPTKLERLIEKEAQLKAQIQQAKAAERTLEKKRDTRRKILIGAAVLARVERGEWPQSDLLRMMDGFLTRPQERELFGLDGDGGSAEEGRAATQAVSVKSKATDTAKAGDNLPADTGERKAAKKTARKAAKPLPEQPVDLDDEFNL